MMYLSEMKEFDKFVRDWIKIPIPPEHDPCSGYRSVLNLGLDRQVGKTSYALKLLDEIEECYLFTINGRFKKFCDQLIKRGYLMDVEGNKHYYFNNKDIIKKIFNAGNYSWKGRSFKGLIILDDFSYMDKEILSVLKYGMLGYNNKFIHLG